ncbi:MAG: hypothetical protein GY854_22530 [Deltaproteobacteria bacterium]|nr:hypothetical protein [Deltaproteobacteria bacterium]
MVKNLKKDSFEPHLNTVFKVHAAPEEAVEVELVEVTAHEREHLESFDVIFRGPEDKPLGQDTYRIEHADMGERELFLVPVIPKQGEAGMFFQASFSRLREPTNKEMKEHKAKLEGK